MSRLANEESSSLGAAGYAVWGSSSGWLVFYAAVGLGIKSVGYELLRCHVDTAAAAAAAAAAVPGDLATFVRGDMLDAPLGEAVRVVGGPVQLESS